MRARRELRNPRVVAPFVAVLIAVVWVSCACAVPCPRVMFFRVGDQFAVMGWTIGENEFDAYLTDDFGGYRLWMREVWKDPDPSPENFSLVAEYILPADPNEPPIPPGYPGHWHFPAYWDEEPFCTEWVTADSCNPDSLFVGVRRDSGAMFNNAFPYEFAITAFSASDPEAVNYDCIESTRTGVIYPRVGTRSGLDAVRCIPNPYRASADWEYGGQRRVTFIGLPEKAEIRIYTAAADHVRTLKHSDAESDLEFWDLTNSDGEEVAPGVYIYQVEAEGLGSKASKVMIIK